MKRLQEPTLSPVSFDSTCTWIFCIIRPSKACLQGLLAILSPFSRFQYVIMRCSPCSLTLIFFLSFQRETHLECFHGSWDRVVSCQPVDCGLPDQSHVYHAIFSCPWGTTFGKQCSFTCGSPAILQGKSMYLLCSIHVC